MKKKLNNTENWKEKDKGKIYEEKIKKKDNFSIIYQDTDSRFYYLHPVCYKYIMIDYLESEPGLPLELKVIIIS